MLPPFKIRQLHLRNPFGPPDEGQAQITVRISLLDYNEVILKHPEAALSYMDEDDGEIVTVGSSLELQDRLNEPVPLSPTSPISTSMHIFDINTQETGVLGIWRDIVTRSGPPGWFDMRGAFNKNTEMTGSATEYWQDPIIDLEAKRVRCFEATNPPQSAPMHSPSESSRDRQLYPDLKQGLDSQKEAMLQKADPLSLNQPFILRSAESPHSILTNEGRQQAKDAGAKLRSSIKPSGSKDQFTVQPEKVAHQNRWVSYGRAAQSTSYHGEGKVEADRSTGESSLSATIKPISTEKLARGNDLISAPTVVIEKIHSHKQNAEMKPLTTSTKGKVPQIQQSQKPLLEAFEAELAGLVEKSPKESPHNNNGEANIINDAPPLVASTQDSSSTHISPPAVNGTSPSPTRAPAAADIASPGDLITHTIRSFVDGVGLLASDLRTTFPEAHDDIALAQQHMPQAFEQVVWGAFRGFGAHVQSLANFVQEATAAAGDVADRTAQLETEALMGAVEGLQSLAQGVGEISRGIFGSVPSNVAVGLGEGNGEIAETAMDAGPRTSASDDIIHARVVSDASSEANANPASSLLSAQTAPQTLPGKTLRPETLHISQDGITSAVESVSLGHPKSSPRAINQQTSLKDATQRLGEAQEHQALPISANLTSMKVSTPEEYETVHQKKREEAADERQAVRRRVKNLLEKTEQRTDQCSASKSSTLLDCQIEDSDAKPTVTVDCKPNYDRNHNIQGVVSQDSKPSDPPPPTASDLDLLGRTPRACAPGCSLGLETCHNHCTTSDLPYYPRPDINRGRRPRRSLSSVSPRLPYEYIIPPTDYRDQAQNVKEPSMPFLEDRDECTRSRSPPIRRKMYRSPPRRPPPGWPRFPRHGPIHLPHDTSPLCGEAQHGSRSSKVPRMTAYSGRSRESDLAQRHAQPLGLEETQVNTQQHQPVSALRHRQSWHPGSHGRPVDRLRARIPANLPVETATPHAKVFSTADITNLDGLRHSRSFAATRERKTNFWTQAASRADNHLGNCREWIDSSDHVSTAPEFRSFEGGPTLRDQASEIKLDKINGHPPSQGSETLKRASTLVTPASNQQRSALQPYPISPAPPPPFPIPHPTASEELIQPSQFPEMNRFPSLHQFENGPSTFRYSPPFPPLPSMNPLIPNRPINCAIKPSQSNNSFSPQVSLESNDDRPQDYSLSAPGPPSEALYTHNASVHLPSHSIERGNEFKPDGSGTFAGMKTLPVRPAGLGPPEPGARLARPFDPLDPLAESVTLHRNRLIQGVRRSATERHAQPDHLSLNRSSYPRYYDARRFSLQEPRRASKVTEAPRTNANTSTTRLVDFADLHEDTTTVGKVQECVEQLKVLGFGTEDDGGVGRLVIYAQAADGDLEAAMEIIEEERKAYQQNASRPGR
ncbi:MAG: hypothetical protein M1836_000630 [Candelina mexicana]|nr:MAG: hypothetical protein M1836_000630 [Candelina mexicana]